MSRAENAMFKAEETLKKIKAEWSEAEKVERAAWTIVWSFEKAWNEKHPDKKGYWFDDPNWRKAEKIAMKKYYVQQELKAKIVKAQEFFELKQRQWHDFLVRDEKRVKHCSCGDRDNSAMVQCDECFKWIHLKCACMTEEEAQALPEYICGGCQVDDLKKFMNDFIRHEAGEIDDDGNSVASEE